MPPPEDQAHDEDAAVRTGILALQEAARRAAAAGRFQVHSEERLLQLIVDATVSLFGSEAASIALFERNPDRLEFRVAGGERGSDVVGISVAPTEGIVGYVYSTGEAVALSDITSDPRFDREVAERTGYVPRSVAAVPLVSDNEVVGVLQALDKEAGETFSPRDMELLAGFAAQAAAAIAGTRVQHDLPGLLTESLAQLAPDLTDEQVRDLVSRATVDLDENAATPFWALVDQVSRLRDLGESELDLVSDILDVVATHQSHRSRFGRR
jgi:GAF domain-containing protein